MSMFQIALFGLFGYSLYLLVKNLVAFYKEGEKKLVLSILGLWFAWAGVIFLGALLPEPFINIWLLAPYAFFVFAWICAGVFVDSFYKNRHKALKENTPIDPAKEPTPTKRKRFLIFFLVGLIIWLTGYLLAFNNYLAGEEFWEYFVLVVSLFLFTSGLYGLWRNRKSAEVTYNHN